MATMSVDGEDIAQQEYENEAGWRLVNRRGRANKETTTHEAKDQETHFSSENAVNDRNIGRGTHPDQKPSPSFKHKTKTALRLLPPHLCRDTDRGPDRGPDRGLDPRPAIPGLPDHRREEDPKAQKDRAASVAPRDRSR
ncbi:hypothetical protein MRX96_000653 [Rhipicephalus microplus]